MTAQASAWMRLPGELRALPQWAVAGASKAPLSASADGKLYHTAVNRPSEWMSFEQAVQLAWDNRDRVTSHVDKKGRTVTQTGFNIGFMINDSDPYTCIDLDVKDAVSHPDEPELHTSQDQFDRYRSIYETMDSYTELSRSGKGLHVWIRADIGRGFRRDGVEVYSRERFIISTGQVVLDRPIADRQTLVARMVSQMRPVGEKFVLEEFPEEEGDWLILDRATTASNSDKFNALWAGKWVELGFPSQSEADLALVSMLTFYSPSNEQVRRMFRDSELGKREKAVKDDRYINLTLNIIREREHREQLANLRAMVDAADYAQQLGAEDMRQRAAAAIAKAQGFITVPAPDSFGQVPSRSVTSLHEPGQGEPPTAPAPAAVALAQMAPVSAVAQQAGEEGIPWPPGLAGAIARFVYQSAPRPVKEVAIVAALGLLSGICGKAWHIPQSGLNLYIILVARSGVGKEAMHSGISAIIKACSRENPMFHNFIDFTEYASGPALTKGCVANPCFVNVSGEWGRKLKRLAQEDGRDAALQTLRTQMTNLYQKSGPTAIVGGIGYSSTDNNVASIAGVSYSLIGETTPGTFYEALTESMMEDGFLSRFLIVEYEGDRPPENAQRIDAPDTALKDVLNNMAVQAALMIGKDYSCPVGRDEEAATLMNEFNLLCDANINATNDESKRQMWNRAALKSLRVAALLAVADNWMTPCIRKHHVEWAQLVVKRDIAVMKRRLETGDVGAGDNARERKMIAILKDYLVNPVPASYKVSDAMRQNSIVPRSYLQVRTKQVASFNNHKLGPIRALDDCVTSMIANGYIMEVQKDKVAEAYSYHGKSYRIIRLPDADSDSRT
jgi:Protein of unknown function (DUF3987)